MYEEATVLDYEGKKIWIKRADEYLHYVNGHYIGFSAKQDISNVVEVATAVDEFYSPWHNGVLRETSIITFSELRNGRLTVSHYDLSDIDYDRARIDDVRREYEEWRDNIDISDIYIDDCRAMDLGEWIDREDAKYERAGL